MRSRALHLACVLLLLASISSAEVSVVQAGGFGNHYISALLRKNSAEPRAETASARGTRDTAEPALPAAPTAHPLADVHSPALQVAAVHAVTGSGL